MRVLLVEDEIRLAENIASALREGPGLAVDCAENGEVGLDLAGIPHRKGGINAALDYLTEQGRAAASTA